MLSWLKCVGGVMGRSTVESPVDGLESMRRRRERAMDGLEGLEQRTMLSGLMGPFPPTVGAPTTNTNQASTYQTANVTWRGHTVEAVKDSWIITLTGRNSKDEARLKGQQVAAALGVVADAIVPSTLGRFVELRTHGAVNESAFFQARQQLGFLHNIAPNVIVHPDLVPNDARYNEQWALNNTGQPAGNSGTGTSGADIEAEPAWNLTTGTRQVIIAVLDTGIDLNHPDLRANIWSNPGEIPNNNVDDDNNGFVDDVNGWDFAGGQDGNGQDNNPTDPIAQGHGTSVAGIIGAVGNNGLGVVGVAWQISLLPIKIFPETGGASRFSSNNAIEYVTLMRERGINIIASNNSWGAVSDADPDQFDDSEQIAIQEHTDAGVLFVAAAGNDSIDNDGISRAYPASYTNPFIISAAATTNSDGLAGFSNYGLTSVDVGAPGEQVLTTEFGGGYRLIDGTSFASPYTAGVIGMMASLNRFANKTQLRDTLYATVDPTLALQGKVVTGGRINLFKALTAIGVPGPVVAAVSPSPQTPPVDTIIVQFSKTIDPSFFDVSNIRLIKANGDGAFNSNDIDVTINPANVDLTDNLLTINLGGQLANDKYRLILNNVGFRDLPGNFLNGAMVSGNDEVYDFNVVTFRGPLEPNDQINEAVPVVLDAGGFASFNDLVIGDGLFQTLDIDMFRVFANGPSLITVTIDARTLAVPSELDSFLRLFDSNGVLLATNDNFNGLDSKLEYFVPAGGFFYIGVSAYPNVAYLPTTGGTGIVGDTAGTYGVSFSVFTPVPEPRSTANNTPTPIPDVNIITSTINITDGRSISDLNLTINITHSFVGDLRVQLTSPSNQVITLINRRGGDGDNITTIFDAEAANAVTGGVAPFAGSFRPEDDLTVLYNTSAAGLWTLTIQDFKAGDFGTLNSWSLDLTLTNNLFGPFELNDLSAVATDSTINGTGSRTFNAAIGDGAYGLRDVDLFRFVANSGTTIQALANPTGAQVDTVLRLFDAAGNELAIDKRKGSRSSTVSFVVVSGGVFYVGVSGGNTTNSLDFGNTSYNPLLGGSGTNTDATGDYTLLLSITGGVGEGSAILAGNQISVGLNSDASIGLSNSTTPTGLKLGNNEFLLLGSLESYFGIIADGFIGRNDASGSQSDIALSLNNESDAFNRRATASGIFRSISIKRSLSFGVNDRTIAVDIQMQNVGTETIADTAWVEGFNPNQGLAFMGGDSRTTNDIDSTGRLATASSNGLTLGLGAPNSAFGEFASFERRGGVRDPFQVINSPADPDNGLSDQQMSLAFNLGTLSPNEIHTFRYFIFLGTLSQVQTAFATIDAGTGTGHQVADPNDLGIAPSSLPYAVYYPEGFAGSGTSTFIPMVNPHNQSVRVVIIAHYEGTAAPDVLFDSATDVSGGLIGASRRFGYTLTNPTLFASGTPERVASEYPGRDGVRKKTPYAIEVRSSLPVGATFSHYDQGISTGEAFTAQTSTVWTFGDVTKGLPNRDFLIFYNPNTVPTKVTLTVYPESGSTQKVISSTFTIGGERRAGWAINKILGLINGKYSLRLDSDLPLVAAVTHYNPSIKAGFASLGVPSAGTTRGSTGEGEYGTNATNEFVTIVNTNTLASTVTITLNYSTGSALRRTITAPALKRTTVDIGSLPGIKAGTPFSISYESNRAVGVSLSSYSFGEGTGSALVSQAATQWLFGEGFRSASNPNRTKDYLRLFNPTSSEVRVAITINYNTGENETFFQTLNARTAGVYNLHNFITGVKRNSNAFYGVKVQSAIPIVAFFGHFDSSLGAGFGTPGSPLGTVGLPS